MAIAMVGASCTSGQVVDTRASQEAPQAEVETGLAAADDGQPGFAALRSKGCTGSPPSNPEVSDFYEWVPIELVAKTSNVIIEGTVIAVSEPRISTTERDAYPGGPSLTHFRILSVAIDRDQSSMIRTAPDLDSEIEVLLIGAGVEAKGEEFCFVVGGDQDPREVPLKEGDSVVVVGDLRSDYPIIGLKGKPVVSLTYGLAGMWKVEPDGSTQSAITGYSIDSDELRSRLKAEFEAVETGEPLGLDDSLANEPDDEGPRSPSTTAPPPPGADAPDSPTIVPPTEPEK